MLRGGTKGDLKWDYMHGFIYFDEIDPESHVNEHDLRREHEEIRRCFAQYCQQNPVLRCKPDLIHWVNATVADYLTKVPKTTREAYMAPDCDHWKKAMSEEFESSLKMSVLEPLTPEEA